MTDYTYSRVAALNFNTTPASVAKSATGSVYAIADTTFTTPLNVTMVVGNFTTTTLSSDASGFFPDFTVANRTSVVWKQNSSAFTTVLTTTDPVPGPPGSPGTPGTQGVKGDRGDLATWQTATFYPLNQVIANPSGDLVKVTTAHTSGASYDATKFDYVVPPTLTPAALNATYATAFVVTPQALAGAASVSDVIQAKINEAFAAGGGLVLIDVKGTVTLDRKPLDGSLQGQSIYLRSNVTLAGRGKGVTRLVLDPASPLTAAGQRYWPVRIGLSGEAANNVVVENLTVDLEAFKTASASGAGVFGIAARHDEANIALHSDDVEIRYCEVIGGDIGIGCTKEGNADLAQQEPRLSQQFRNWSIHHNTVRRVANKTAELAEANGGYIGYNECDNVADGPQAIFSTRNTTIEHNFGTFTSSGINVTQGATDIKVLYNRMAADPSAPTTINRGAMVLRAEDQAVASTIARVLIRGNTFTDTVKSGNRVLAFQSRALTTALTVEDITFEDNRFEGNVDLKDILTPVPSPAKTTLRRIKWGAGNTVTGAITADTAVTTYDRAGGIGTVTPEYPCPPTAQAAWPAANQARFGFFTIETLRLVSKVYATMGTASGNVQVGIVRMTDATAYTRVAHTGIIAAAGQTEFDMGGTIALTPGRYALFIWADNTTVQFPLITSSPVTALKVWSNHSSLVGGVGSVGTLPVAGSNVLVNAAVG